MTDSQPQSAIVPAPGGVSVTSGHGPAPSVPPEGPQAPPRAPLASYAPHRVLGPDHPLRLLAEAIQHHLTPDAGGAMARLIDLTTKAYIEKRAAHRQIAYERGLVQLLRFEQTPGVLDVIGSLDMLRNLQAVWNYMRDRAEGTPKREKAPKKVREPRAPKVDKGGEPHPAREPRPRSTGPKDEVAQAMLGLTLDEMYAYAETMLNTPQDQLRAKYGHLNSGMQRMNLGNRIRSCGSAK